QGRQEERRTRGRGPGRCPRGEGQRPGVLGRGRGQARLAGEEAAEEEQGTRVARIWGKHARGTRRHAPHPDRTGRDPDRGQCRHGARIGDSRPRDPTAHRASRRGRERPVKGGTRATSPRPACPVRSPRPTATPERGGAAAASATCGPSVTGDPDGRFRIASISKPFTATLVLQLADEGRIGLDDTVGEHLPGLLPYSEPITVRQLLQHTSGLPRDLPPHLTWETLPEIGTERFAPTPRNASYVRALIVRCGFGPVRRGRTRTSATRSWPCWSRRSPASGSRRHWTSASPVHCSCRTPRRCAASRSCPARRAAPTSPNTTTRATSAPAAWSRPPTPCTGSSTRCSAVSCSARTCSGR